MITPPIALAAFAAAALTQAGAMRTGFAAVRFGWIAYLIPFLFIFNSALLMTGTVGPIVWATVKALVGIYLVTIAIVGFYRRRLGALPRVAFALAGLAALLSLGKLPQAETFGPVALAFGALLIAVMLVTTRRAPAA